AGTGGRVVVSDMLVTSVSGGNLIPLPLRLNEHLRHFRPAELRRKRLPITQQLADSGAAQHDVRLRSMRAGLGRRHAIARAAEERVIEEQRLNAELARGKRAKDMVRVVRAVVVANACVIAAD